MPGWPHPCLFCLFRWCPKISAKRRIMVNGFVMKPKTTERGETMNRPTKKTTMRKHTREQMLALLHNDEAIKDLLQTTIQTVLEAEMDEVLGTGKGERNDARRGYPQRALPASAHDAGRHVGVAGAAGPRRVVFNRIVCPVISAAKRRRFWRWRRCMCRASPPARCVRSPRSCADTASARARCRRRLNSSTRSWSG